MRPAIRLLASVQRSGGGAQFLEPGAPTGLTGLLTHSSPRSTLLYLYSTTLDKLKQFPESSVYRQSTEALTKHRMSIVEKTKPAGLEEWQTRVQKVVEKNPEAFRKIAVVSSPGSKEFNFVWKSGPEEGPKKEEWEDEMATGLTKPIGEGPRDVGEKWELWRAMVRDPVGENLKVARIEPEPPLSVEQVNAIEQEIGAGLIEEVIQVAEGESELVDKMAEAKM